MIAMALAGRPKLLIADEPTSALDVSVAAEIVSLLSGLGQEFGLSVLIITHDLGVATKLSDRISVMEHGELIESIPARSFLSQATHAASRKLIEASFYLSVMPDRAQAADESLPLFVAGQKEIAQCS